MKKNILIGLLIIFGLIQFIRIDKTNPPVDSAKDFLVMTSAPEDIQQMVKASCYDCHSHESRYPWYSNVAPVSWWVKDHILEAREELNFSEWGTYEWKKMDHKMEECVEEIEEHEMPLKPYVLAHQDANLTDDQRTQLMDWFNHLRQNKIGKSE